MRKPAPIVLSGVSESGHKWYPSSTLVPIPLLLTKPRCVAVSVNKLELRHVHTGPPQYEASQRD